MTRRNGLFVLLFLPIILLFFIIGWALYWIGSQRKSGSPKTVFLTPSKLKFFVLTPEEEKEATDKHYESRRGKNDYKFI